MGMVKKDAAASPAEAEAEAGAQSNVRPIASAKGSGRPSGRGYDPASSKEVVTQSYLDHLDKNAASESDVFSLVNERGYRPDRFYTRSLNADGHGERMQVRVPQGIDSQIYAAVAEIAEYRSVHDFMRDAAVHRLEYLQKHHNLGEGARRSLELERLQADRERRAQEAGVMQASVEDLAEKLQGLWDKEDWGLMAEELEEGSESVDWLRDPYKTRAAKVLEDWKGRARVKIAEARANNEID